MENSQNTPRALFRVIKVMYFAILIGTIMFIVASLVFAMQSGNTIIEDADSLQYIWFASLFLTMAMIPGAYYFYRKKFEDLDQSQNLVQKLIFYKTPFTIRLALLEACCIIDTTFFLVTGNKYILYAAIISLIVIIINYPTRTAISNDLKLSTEETNQI